MYCVTNIYRNYCTSSCSSSLYYHPIHSVLALCIGTGGISFTGLADVLVTFPPSVPLSSPPSHPCRPVSPSFTPHPVSLPQYYLPTFNLLLVLPRRATANTSPMQYYISGTIAFLIIEMTAQFAYYRYINKHGGGTSSLIFLFVIATLSAARNSLSFFLLLIVCMGLSVVTQDLGGIMGRVRALTGAHFVFGGKSRF